MATKTYPALKTFFQEAYGRHLMAIKLRNTTGQNGYTNNIYNAFANGDENTDDDTDTTIVTVPPKVPQAAATVTVAASSLGTTPGSAINAELATAINQLSANQTAIMSQMAAMSFTPATTHDTQTQQHMFQIPPIQQLAFPVQQSFQQAAFNGSRRGGRNRRCGRGGRGCTLFADHMRMTGGSSAMQHSVFPPTRGGTQVPPIHGGAQMNPFQGGQQQARKKPDYSNIYKRYNNWNVCFACGFDVKDGHTSATCLFRKANHQMSFTRGNAQQFIVAGYDPCTKGMHKTVLPSERAT